MSSEAHTKKMVKMASLLYTPFKTASVRDLPPKEGFTSWEWDLAITQYERAAVEGLPAMPQAYVEFFKVLRERYVTEADAFVDLT
jgi:hypothetical protein